MIENFLKSETFLIILFALTVISTLGFIIMIVKTNKIVKKYNKFIKKLGDSSKIEEDLLKYMNRVERVEKQNSELVRACDILDDNLKKCIQKTGMVRYNAYEDTGSELSFALALLDDKNCGVVLNGIYSREMSNIYAKPVVDGKSMYKASSEEIEAINRAVKGEEKN